MEMATYTVELDMPPSCPRNLEFAVPRLGVDARLAVGDDGRHVQLSFVIDVPPDEWGPDTPLLVELDVEARRVVAVLCVRYVIAFRAPLRKHPTNMAYFDIILDLFDDPAEVEAQAAALSSVLPAEDPTAWPLWQAFVSTGSLRDPVSRFIALWGLLDIGLGASRVDEFDEYLMSAFGVPADHPDRRGALNKETKFANLRHSIAHPSGRGVNSVPDLSELARGVLPELMDICREAVRNDFAGAGSPQSNKASSRTPEDRLT